MLRLVSCLVLLSALGCASKDAEHPSPSATPSGSAPPANSANAAPSAAPEGSAGPVASAAPEGSAGPVASAAPEGSAGPVASAAPEGSAGPVASAAPEGSAGPVASAAPEGAARPVASAAPTPSRADGSWTYGGDTGPSFWGDLRPEYAPCKVGAMQSPVDFPSRREAPPAKEKPKAKPAEKPKDKAAEKPGDKPREAATEKAAEKPKARAKAKDKAKEPPKEVVVGSLAAGTRLSVDYLPIPLALRNDGHTVEVTNRANNYLTLDGKRFELLAVQFHSPSEHTFAGRRFDLEMQLVHKASDGKTAIVAVVFEPGVTVEPLLDLWKRLPKQPSPEPVAVKGKPFDVGPLVALAEGYYAYEGSWTTPPCTEGVIWLVMKKPQTIGAKEVERYRDLFSGRTNRMVMPLGDRPVFELRP
ncbi:MAG: carbonic anhydrase family protein [Deltaproteobacteria bacterium]|nr:carbonic anhydrase family protein [Deltaproteobacteria bacterium]